jgi:hypothetical protein
MDRTNYLFVDFENIHEVDLDLIGGKPVKVILILGERHKKLPVDMVKKLLKYQAQVQLIEAGRSGKNALDFVLSYRIGVESVADPKGFFHIVSRDKGFDPLILHLKNNKISAARHESFAKIPVLAGETPGRPRERPKVSAPRPTAVKPKSGTALSAAERVMLMTERLAANKTNRPKRKKTLLAHIFTHFGKRLSTGELDEILEALVANSVIEITPRGAVVYKI